MKQLLIDIRIMCGLEINDFIWRGCLINFHESHAVRACFERQRGRLFRGFDSAGLAARLPAEQRGFHARPMEKNLRAVLN